MKIIEGRGNNRKVIVELPHGSIFQQAAKNEPLECLRAIAAVQEILLGRTTGLLKLTNRQMQRIVNRTVDLHGGANEEVRKAA